MPQPRRNQVKRSDEAEGQHIPPGPGGSAQDRSRAWQHCNLHRNADSDCLLASTGMMTVLSWFLLVCSNGGLRPKGGGSSTTDCEPPMLLLQRLLPDASGLASHVHLCPPSPPDRSDGPETPCPRSALSEPRAEILSISQFRV